VEAIVSLMTRIGRVRSVPCDGNNYSYNARAKNLKTPGGSTAENRLSGPVPI